MTLRQEFPNKEALHEVVDRAAFVNCFGYVIKKSDKERYVPKKVVLDVYDRQISVIQMSSQLEGTIRCIVVLG